MTTLKKRSRPNTEIPPTGEFHGNVDITVSDLNSFKTQLAPSKDNKVVGICLGKYNIKKFLPSGIKLVYIPVPNTGVSIINNLQFLDHSGDVYKTVPFSEFLNLTLFELIQKVCFYIETFMCARQVLLTPTVNSTSAHQ